MFVVVLYLLVISWCMRFCNLCIENGLNLLLFVWIRLDIMFCCGLVCWFLNIFVKWCWVFSLVFVILCSLFFVSGCCVVVSIVFVYFLNVVILFGLSFICLVMIILGNGSVKLLKYLYLFCLMKWLMSLFISVWMCGVIMLIVGFVKILLRSLW